MKPRHPLTDQVVYRLEMDRKPATGKIPVAFFVRVVTYRITSDGSLSAPFGVPFEKTIELTAKELADILAKKGVEPFVEMLGELLGNLASQAGFHIAQEAIMSCWTDLTAGATFPSPS